MTTTKSTAPAAGQSGIQSMSTAHHAVPPTLHQQMIRFSTHMPRREMKDHLINIGIEHFYHEDCADAKSAAEYAFAVKVLFELLDQVYDYAAEQLHQEVYER